MPWTAPTDASVDAAQTPGTGTAPVRADLTNTLLKTLRDGVAGVYTAALQAIAGLTPSNLQFPYFTGPTSATTGQLTPFSLGFLSGAADQTTAKSYLGVSGGGGGAPTAHEASHLSGGTDALAGNLDATSRVQVLNAGTLVAARRGLNLVPGGNVTLTAADNPGAERVDVTIAAAGGGGGGGTPSAHEASHLSGGSDALAGNLDAVARTAVQQSGGNVGSRRSLNFLPSANITIAATDNAGAERVDLAFGFTGAVQPTNHEGTHLSGGSDALVGSLDAVARTAVSLGGAAVGSRRGLNLVQGTNVTLTVTDNPGAERVDVTVAASGSGGSGGFTVTSVKTAAYTAAPNDLVRTDTSAGQFTVAAPPAPADGARFIVEDDGASWTINNLLVSPNGSTINGFTTNFSAGGRGARAEFLFTTGQGWTSRYTVRTLALQAANALSEIGNPAAAKANLGVVDPPGAGVTGIGTTYSSGSKLWSSQGANYANGSITLAALSEYWMLYWWAWNFTPSLLGVEVQTAVAAANVKLAVHLMNADFSIGTRLGASGTLDGSTTGVKSGSIAPGAAWVGPSLYWVGLLSDQAVAVRCTSTSGQSLSWLPYRATNQGTGVISRTAGSFAAGLPATPPALSALSSPSPGAGMPATLLGIP